MSVRVRLSVLRMSLCLAAVAVTVGCASSPTRPPDCPQLTVEEWLASHPEPIRTRAQLLEVPRGLQRGVFATLPAEIKSQMWTEKVERTIEQAGLNEEQDASLRRLLPLLTPSVWESSSAGTSPANAWYLEAQSLFSRDQLGRIGVSLEDFAKVTREPAQSSACALAGEDCDCSTKDDWCGFPFPQTIHCESDRDCTRVTNCGYWWAEVCNGHCTGLGPPR